MFRFYYRSAQIRDHQYALILGFVAVQYLCLIKAQHAFRREALKQAAPYYGE